MIPDLTLDQVPLVASVAAQLALLGAIDTLLSALLADSPPNLTTTATGSSLARGSATSAQLWSEAYRAQAQTSGHRQHRSGRQDPAVGVIHGLSCSLCCSGFPDWLVTFRMRFWRASLLAPV